MEKELLDTAHGWRTETQFVLDQVWMLGGQDVARVTVTYSTAGISGSASEVVVGGVSPEDEEVELLRLHTFPSQWWGSVNTRSGSNEPQPVMEAVAESLVERAAVVCDRLAAAIAEREQLLNEDDDELEDSEWP